MNEQPTNDRPRGRPTKYRADTVERATRLAEAGATMDEIAHGLNIGTNTLRVWCRQHEDLRSAIKMATTLADIEVEDALRNRALGKCLIKEQRVSSDGITTTIVKTVPPDPTSIVFWLANRQPEHWKRNRDAVVNPAVADIDPNEGLWGEAAFQRWRDRIRTRGLDDALRDADITAYTDADGHVHQVEAKG